MSPLSSSDSSRRRFLKSSGAISLGFLGLHKFVSDPAGEANLSPSPRKVVGYGPLLPDPDKILNLPKGFSYRIISRQGEPMQDGLLVPGKADGMATFAGPNGKTILIRNHEMSPETVKEGAFGSRNELLSKINKDLFYDFGKGEKPSLGGTTTLVFDPRSGKVESQYLSLAGTNRNCAGGRTPWNSWITCEESTEKAGGTIEKDHGYCFEVPASSTPALASPVPLKAMGRFNHEAVAVDPRTGIVYLTEDRPDGLIYRFLPNEKGKLAKGGKLQALVIQGEKSFDTRNWKTLTTPKLPQNKPAPLEWKDLDRV